MLTKDEIKQLLKASVLKCHTKIGECLICSAGCTLRDLADQAISTISLQAKLDKIKAWAEEAAVYETHRSLIAGMQNAGKNILRILNEGGDTE